MRRLAGKSCVCGLKEEFFLSGFHFNVRVTVTTLFFYDSCLHSAQEDEEEDIK